MTKEEFFIEFMDILQRDDPVQEDDSLAGYEEWDSMAIMSLMVWFESRLNIRHPFNFYAGLKSVREILEASEGQIE